MTIAHVQDAYNTNTASTTLVTTLGAGTTSGNALIVAQLHIGGGTGVTPPAPSGVGGTWVQGVTIGQTTTYNANLTIWYNLTPTAGSTAVTTTATTAYGTHYAWLMEFSGLASSSTVNSSSTVLKPTNSGTTINPGTLTPGVSIPILLISSMSITGGGPTISAIPSGYTNVPTGGVGTRQAAVYQIVSSPTGSYTGSFTATNQYNNSVAVIIAFNGSGGTPPVVNSNFFQFF